MNIKLYASAIALAVAGSAASATTISVQSFSMTEWSNKTMNAIATEDFETPNDMGGVFLNGDDVSTASSGNYGVLRTGDFLETDVGTFTTAGGVGSGGTCGDLLASQGLSGNECRNIALQYSGPLTNGQENIVPDEGEWSINTADTLGLIWNVDVDGMFNQLVFALRDPADVGLKQLTIELNNDESTAVTFTKAANPGLFDNNEAQLFHIVFSDMVGGAVVKLETSENDAFNFDGAAAVVPLPAAGWMLLAGLGGLAAMRRRQKA